MTTVFFIAYQFPPLNIGGSFRPLYFVKYFNYFDIKPIIFTLAPDDYPKVYHDKAPDYGLLSEIDSVEKEIIYVKSDDLLKSRKNKISEFFQIWFNLSKGSEHKKWKKSFFEEAEKALIKYKPKAIIVTAPPFGIVELSRKFSKKHDLPYIIDMRDSLSMWVSQPYGSFFHYKLTLLKERRWFNTAEKIIAVTEEMIEDWKQAHKKIRDDRYVVIPNGFDGELSFSELNIPKDKDQLTIGYVGSFYYNPESRNMIFTPWYKKRFHRKLQYIPRKEDWLYRSPYFFFKTLQSLFEQYPMLKNRIMVKFAGSKPNWLIQMIDEFNLKENIDLLGFLNYKEIVAFQKECDLLLITSVKVIDGYDYCIAGKSFDYIKAEKPILGFVTPGAQKKFLLNSGVAIICDPDNIEDSIEKIKNIFNFGINLTPNRDFLENFQRIYLTKKLSSLF